MKDIVFLKRKFNNIPDSEIYEFLNKINDLSLNSVYSLTVADTYFIRKKLGIFDSNNTIKDKDLADMYEMDVRELKLKEANLFIHLNNILMYEYDKKLVEKVKCLKEKKNILNHINMEPEDYILLSDINFSHKINWILEKNNIKTVNDISRYSFIDLLKIDYVSIDMIEKIDKRLEIIGYSIKKDYNLYSYQELKELIPNKADDVKRYVHSKGICLKGEEESDIVALDNLDLSARSLNALTRENIECIGDLRNALEDIRDIRNLGEKSIFEIYKKLDEYNKKDMEKSTKKLIK